MSEGNIDEFLERVQNESGQLVFTAMTIPDYELMAYNMQELRRYILEMKEVIVYYRTVTNVDDSEGQSKQQ